MFGVAHAVPLGQYKVETRMRAAVETEKEAHSTSAHMQVKHLRVWGKELSYRNKL